MTFLIEIILLGLQNLRRHKLRSILTSLGIILGVASVIVMIAIGEGSKRAGLRDIEALGATNVIVRSVQPPESGDIGNQERSFVASFGLTRKDRRLIEANAKDAVAIVPLKAVGDEVSYGAQRTISQAFGSTPELAEVANLRVARGRYLSEQDMEERSPVAVIGSQIEQQFFPIEDPMGKEIRIADRVFRVIGVLHQVGLAGGAGSALVGRDLNLDVHIPFTTAEMEFSDVVQRRQAGSFSGEEVQVSEIYVTAPDTDSVPNIAARIKRAMEVDHPNLDDVEVFVPWELLEERKRRLRVWNLVLVAIASISLLVGGIGIMNIMLASVTERTREIGIRRALGATQRDITVQFIVETGALSCAGGLIGIATGVSVALAIAAVSRGSETSQIETAITSWSIIASFVVAAAVGLIFGIYPAVQASRKDPIVALRHD